MNTWLIHKDIMYSKGSIVPSPIPIGIAKALTNTWRDKYVVGFHFAREFMGIVVISTQNSSV